MVVWISHNGIQPDRLILSDLEGYTTHCDYSNSAALGYNLKNGAWEFISFRRLSDTYRSYLIGLRWSSIGENNLRNYKTYDATADAGNCRRWSKSSATNAHKSDTVSVNFVGDGCRRSLSSLVCVPLYASPTVEPPYNESLRTEIFIRFIGVQSYQA